MEGNWARRAAAIFLFGLVGIWLLLLCFYPPLGSLLDELAFQVCGFAALAFYGGRGFCIALSVLVLCVGFLSWSIPWLIRYWVRFIGDAWRGE